MSTAVADQPAPIGAPSEAALREALALAIAHIDHMAAWITKQNPGYSFESLGEDLPGIREALGKTGK